MKKATSGFTIVELLIVIVVIAILAAISVVVYTGVQGRAMDSQRHQDIKTIAKALEMYYLDNGSYPVSSCSGLSCPDPKKINTAWSTTSDGSWNVLEAALVPHYIQSLPKDPQWSLSTPAGIYGGYNYDYVSGWVGCTLPSGARQGYLLAYKLESSGQQRTISGNCVDAGGSPANYGPASEFIVIKN